MKALVKPLKANDSQKISQEQYDSLYELYVEKKPLLTLDGKERVVISKLSTRFPVVSIAGSGIEIEYSSNAVRRILNSHCRFVT